jgi:hypothetical protein
MSISACQLSRLIEQSGCTVTDVVGEFGHYGITHAIRACLAASATAATFT